MSQEEKDIRTLQEVFGITITEAENTYNYYKKDLNEAITGLSKQIGTDTLSLDQAIERSSLREESSYINSAPGAVATCSPNPAITVTGATNTNPIDLTQESQDDDLQKALALSLQDMHHQNGGISIEDQELSKALEASIADNQTTIDKYGLSPRFTDPLNPHERKRTIDSPVGLKNIGNTCWFSAVIQSLFNISVFRELIINFTINSNTLESDLPPYVLFVLELQKLFALLLQSNQKYINPKPAIDLLNPVFQTLGHQQQDVSEFTHKLLEWIEDAFAYQIKENKSVTCTSFEKVVEEEKSRSSNESDTKEEKEGGVINPMVELFTGECVTEGLLNELPFTNRSKFGAFPVQIEGHTHLHDSLEAATANTEMKQETWFTHLPPVLVLELSRFKYNQTTGQAEKIHDQLSFDRTLYMDRYLQVNCEESRKLRHEMYTLRSKINKLEGILKSYTDYHGKSVGINVVLSLASDYTQHQRDDPHSPAPRSGTEDEVDVVRRWLKQWQSEMSTEITELESSLSATRGTLDAVYADPSMNQTAYHLHAVLVHQGQASRGHYWAYVKKRKENKNQPLVTSDPLEMSQEVTIEEIGGGERGGEGGGEGEREGGGERGGEGGGERGGEGEMEVDTTDVVCSPLPSDTQTPPSVMDTTDHAPLSEEVWLKYNDVSVIEVDWEEVKRESFGGVSTTSAYCLVYLAENKWKENVSSSSGHHSLLPPSLDKYIKDCNLSFENEIKLYDLKKSLQSAGAGGGGGGGGEGGGGGGGGGGEGVGKELIKPAKIVRFATSDHYSERDRSNNSDMTALASDAKRARPDDSTLYHDMQIDMDNLPPVDPSLITLLNVKKEQKLHILSQVLPSTIVEPRLLTEYHYANTCQSNDSVLQALLYESLIADFDKENFNLSLLARKELYTICKDPQVCDELKLIKHLYYLFCCVAYHLIQSVSEFRRNNPCLSLAHIIQCFDLNTQICELADNRYALDHTILGQYRSKALLCVSELGTSAFTSGEVTSSIVIGNEYIVPSLKAFGRIPHPGDETILEKVREEWCQCLDQSSLTEDDSDKLADLLMKIVDDYSKSPNIKVPELPNNFDTQRLAAQFSNAFKVLNEQILL